MDRKDNEAWLKALKQRLDEYSEPPQIDGWERLLREMERKEAPRVLPLWRRPWARVAATVALILASAAVGMYIALSGAGEPGADIQEQVARVTEEAVPAVTQPQAETEPSPTPVPVTSDRRLAYAPPVEHPSTTEEPMTEAQEEPYTGPVEVPPMPDKATEQQPEAKEEQPAEKPRRRPLSEELAGRKPQPKPHSKGRWGMSLAVGNAAGGNGQAEVATPDAPMTRISMVSTYNSVHLVPQGQEVVFASGVPYLKQNCEIIDMNHRQPISAAIALRYQLSRRLSLETGLVYTLLTSEATLPDGGDKATQRLHYLGIPLRLNVDLWQRNRFALYASAGGMVEKNVYGTFDGERLTVDHPQFSLLAAAGVQFNLTRRMGIYAEPGVAYYFEDGSKVETIRSENPVNFTLQAGLRWTY